MMIIRDFDAIPILSYLALPNHYQPSPQSAPVEFLRKHIRELPPHLLALFSLNTTPRERTVVLEIRNRRLKFVESDPHELSLTEAKGTWPALWEGRERHGMEQARAEKEWVEKGFLGGTVKQYVGKLGDLLKNYEEERESERVRAIRRQRAEDIGSLPEEDDEESDENEDEDEPISAMPEPFTVENEHWFQRSIQERFIYGFLESIDYDKVDWNEQWDEDLDRDAEERWFDDEEED